MEVKYRSGASFGDPSEAVTAKKQERIRKTARYYLCARQLSEDTPCRFDVAAVLGSQIRWSNMLFIRLFTDEVQGETDERNQI